MSNLLTRLDQIFVQDFSDITKEYFPFFEDPDVINTGWCFIWAWLAHLKSGAQLLTYRVEEDLDAHALVRIGNRYFDSSHPRGTRGLQRLWFFTEWDLRADKSRLVEMTRAEFQKEWKSNRPLWRDLGIKPWPLSLPRLKYQAIGPW